jgi:hypothetical protein
MIEHDADSYYTYFVFLRQDTKQSEPHQTVCSSVETDSFVRSDFKNVDKSFEAIFSFRCHGSKDRRDYPFYLQIKRLIHKPLSLILLLGNNYPILSVIAPKKSCFCISITANYIHFCPGAFSPGQNYKTLSDN